MTTTVLKVGDSVALRHETAFVEKVDSHSGFRVAATGYMRALIRVQPETGIVVAPAMEASLRNPHETNPPKAAVYCSDCLHALEHSPFCNFPRGGDRHLRLAPCWSVLFSRKSGEDAAPIVVFCKETFLRKLDIES